MKQVRRKVLIREYDYRRLINDNTSGGVFRHGIMLYNRSKFEPLTKKKIEQEKVWAYLQESRQLWQYIDYGVRDIFWGMQDYLYNRQYESWKRDWDDDGYLYIQARSNTPRSIMGWAIFEYDHEDNSISGQ